jgi:VIT1/CCC1 family predicted Fe2+/Mn2+ transporter
MVNLETHKSHTIGWLRAAVLGANDGLISTSSLVVGVAAASAGREPVLISAIAGLVAGALSMAAGEYVSVSSQADTEQADLAKERRELAELPDLELEELTKIYEQRGLDRELAEKVALRLTETDALAAHARDELGITEFSRAKPLQAALASAAAFAVGAAPPAVLSGVLPFKVISGAVVWTTIFALLLLGSLAAKLGGAPAMKGAVRVCFWGAVAMGSTFAIGRLFNTSVAG